MTAAQATSHISSRGRIWLAAWALCVVGLAAGGGLLVVPSIRAHRQAEVGRHAAALDPNADDPGVTAADRTTPTDVQPTRVLAGTYVDRIIQLSVKDVIWTVDFYLWFRWRGETPRTLEGFQVVDGNIETKELEADDTVQGERYQRFRVVAKITKFFDVARFPFDDHLLLIAIEHPAHTRNELIFVADEQNSAVSSRVRVTAFHVKPAVVLEKPHSYKTTRGDPRLAQGAKATYSQLRMGIGLAGAGVALYFKLFQSLYVAVGLAMLAFFIRPTEVDPRFGLGVGALFAAVANAYVISSLVPDTGTLALADVVTAVGIVTILLTVVQSTISLYLFTTCGRSRCRAPLIVSHLQLCCLATSSSTSPSSGPRRLRADGAYVDVTIHLVN